MLLQGTDFEKAHVGWTRFLNTDLRDAKGLDALVHEGPSTIGIDTVVRSVGKIPEVFLRGCGVPENFITYMRSLVGQPIHFYSCFISFTEKDDAV